MSKTLAFATVLVGGLFLASPLVEAHHSFAAVYDGNKPITLRGTVSKLGWSNPHAFIYIDVKGPNGEVVTWQIESAGATTLLRAGIRREDFIGTEVVVKGFLAKDGTPSANAASFSIVGSNKGYVSDERQNP
jgi:hypothetical protein